MGDLHFRVRRPLSAYWYDHRLTLFPPTSLPFPPLRQTSLNLLCSEAATNQYRNADRMLGLDWHSSFPGIRLRQR